jgi:hypothetical protein
MPLRYEDLDDSTRRHMLAELEHDERHGLCYFSPRLNASGQQQYIKLLREAIERHDDQWLSDQIAARGLLKSHEERKNPRGGTITAKVPVTAPQTLADGEFNRFYCRGLCARASAEGRLEIQVYRGQASAHPRPESEQLIGTRLNAAAVLLDLRRHIAVEPALGVPAGPNSGLSIRLPR